MRALLAATLLALACPSPAFPGAFGDCLTWALARTLFPGRMKVEYWTRTRDHLVVGEILDTVRWGNTVFAFRFDGEKVQFNFYKQTDRGLKFVRRFYPPEWLDPTELAGKRMLDLGTGTGELVLDLARLRRSGKVSVNAVGIDLNPPESAQATGLVFKGDAHQLPFGSDRFDFVYSTWSLFSYDAGSDPRSIRLALEQVYKVLRPGGRFRVSPIRMEEIQPIAEEIGFEAGRHGAVPIRFDPHTLVTFGEYAEFVKPGGPEPGR